MSDDKKQSVASMILAKYKDGKAKSMEVTPVVQSGDDDQMNGLVTAMEDFLQALSDKDPQAMAMAFKSAMSLIPDDDDENTQD